LAGKRRYVVVDDRDNVATVVEMLKEGEVIEAGMKNIKLLRISRRDTSSPYREYLRVDTS